MCRMIAISAPKKRDMTKPFETLLSYYSNGNSDGFGVAWLEGDKIKFFKDTAPAADYFFQGGPFPDLDTRAAIGHVRAATSEVCYENTHPFLNEDGSLAMIHNGVVQDYEKLKDELSKKGHTFSSKTVDSEVLLHAYEEWGNDFIKKIKDKQHWGDYNVIFLKRDGTIIGVSDGRLATTRLKNGEVMVSSTKLFENSKEVPTGEMIKVKDGKIIYRKQIFKPYTYSGEYGGYGGYGYSGFGGTQRQISEPIPAESYVVGVPSAAEIKEAVETFGITALAKKELEEEGLFQRPMEELSEKERRDYWEILTNELVVEVEQATIPTTADLEELQKNNSVLSATQLSALQHAGLETKPIADFTDEDKLKFWEIYTGELLRKPKHHEVGMQLKGFPTADELGTFMASFPPNYITPEKKKLLSALGWNKIPFNKMTPATRKAIMELMEDGRLEELVEEGQQAYRGFSEEELAEQERLIELGYDEDEDDFYTGRRTAYRQPKEEYCPVIPERTMGTHQKPEEQKEFIAYFDNDNGGTEMIIKAESIDDAYKFAEDAEPNFGRLLTVAYFNPKKLEGKKLS